MPAQQEALERLDAWLADGAQPFGILLGAPGAGKSTLLARWAHELAASGRADVVLGSLGRPHGAALEQEAFAMLAEGLEGRFESWPAPARNLVDLRMDVEEDLRGERESVGPPLLVILDGLDEGVGWSVGTDYWLPGDWLHRDPSGLFKELGPGTRLLVTANTEAPDPQAEAGDWLRRLSWPPADTASFALTTPLSAALDSALDALLSTISPDTPGALSLLACAFGPLPAADLEALLERAAGQPAPVPLFQDPSLEAALRAGHVDRTPDGAYRFTHGALWQRLQACLPPTTRSRAESAFLELGRAVARALAAGEPPPVDPAPYWIPRYSAHLRAARAPLAEFLDLLTPAWLRAWQPRERALLGAVTDARAARATAEEHLEAASTPSAAAVDPDLTAARVAALTALARSVLVEAALYALEPVTRAARGHRPLARGAFDLDLSLHVGERLAHALRAFAAALSPTDSADRADRETAQERTEPKESGSEDSFSVGPAEVAALLQTGGDHARRMLLRDHPRAALEVLAPADALDLARTFPPPSRIEVLAALAPLLPPPHRSAAITEALALDRAIPDDGTDRILPLLPCAPEIPLPDACRLLRRKILDGTIDLRPLLRRGEQGADWPLLVPLFARLGGAEALRAVAREIAALGGWTR